MADSSEFLKAGTSNHTHADLEGSGALRTCDHGRGKYIYLKETYTLSDHICLKGL